MYPIAPVPKRYAWGSYRRLQTMFAHGTRVDASPDPFDAGGSDASSRPLAEMWFSGHLESPSLLECAGRGWRPVPDEIRRDPVTMVGPKGSQTFGPVLPYLFKIISARIPLSLQVHPVGFEARAGFNRENAAGIPIGVPERSFKDPIEKNEMVVALEPFVAAIGFAPLALSLQLLKTVDHPLAERMASALVARTFMVGRPPASFAAADAMMPVAAAVWPDSHRRLFRAFVAAVTAEPGLARGIGDALDKARDAVGTPRERTAIVNARAAATAFPGDPSVMALLLMNPVMLEEGESVYIPAGTPHAYIHGTAAEIMTNSDNVLRAGMTPKHRDIPNLLANLDCTPALPIDPSSTLFGMLTIQNMVAYRPKVAEYMLVYGHVERGGDEWPLTGRLARRYGELIRRYGPQRLALPQHGPRVLLCTQGSVRCSSAKESVLLRRGQAVFIPAAEGPVSFDPAPADDAGTTAAPYGDDPDQDQELRADASGRGSFLMASTPF